VYEGRAYALDDATGPEGEWVIGRRKGLAVSLDYDPYVSNENSVVVRRDGAYWVRDVAGSKNGTSVNWEPLARGGQRRLDATDVIGVGRSLLAFAPG
jgi:predicted component of type VI protein secretion system